MMPTPIDIMEAGNYNNIKNDPILLLSLIGKYVKVTLPGDSSTRGFVHCIDPEEHNIVLLEPCGECFETVILPGHAVLDVTEIDSIPNVLPPVSNMFPMSQEDLLQRKQKLLLWLKKNQVPIIESEEKIVFGNVAIIPPYGVRNIYAPKLITVMEVRNMVEKMPSDFGEVELENNIHK